MTKSIGQKMKIKRLLDIVLSVAGLLLFSPIFVVVALLVCVTSSGGALFVQTRVGRNEKCFECLKFRTMTAGTPDVGSHHAEQSWITPVGRLLRKTKLDELPQLINVLRGEMSIVGPRPCLPSQQELINARRALGVFSLAPGITGISQTRGVDMSTPLELASLDATYLKSMSLFTDIALMYKTLRGAGKGDAASRRV